MTLFLMIIIIAFLGFNLMLAIEYGGDDKYLGDDGYLNHKGFKTVLIIFVTMLGTMKLVTLFF